MRGWRYNPALSADIDAVVSPLFDVVSVRQREALYQDPLNSIHLSVPRAEGDAAPHAGRVLAGPPQPPARPPGVRAPGGRRRVENQPPGPVA